ncbi:MAG: hypothetical protein J0H82_18645 [Alphaproteobacteria bacterium]|jgi:hypothetical protein|nr:hypothetical protein [Alphaproteobacteria bacterium]
MLETILGFLGGPVIRKVLDLIPDPNERARQEAELRRAAIDLAAKAEAEQRAINLQEAEHPSVFVAGWRPALGWVGVAAFGYTYLFVPLATWVLHLLNISTPPMPSLDGDLWELMFAMLGIGSLRTAEKFKGVETMKVVRGGGQ